MPIRKLYFILREVSQPGKAGWLPFVSRVDLLCRVDLPNVISLSRVRVGLDNTYYSIICVVAQRTVTMNEKHGGREV